MLNEQGINKPLRINAIKKGVILGLILLGLNIFSFYFITGMTKAAALIVAGPFLFTILIPLAATIFLILDMRKKVGGYWSFRQATTGVFIMFMVSYILLSVGRDLVFAKFIERNMVQKTEAVMLEVKASSMKLAGARPADINKDSADLKKEFDSAKTPSLSETVQAYIVNTLFLFVMAIIFAAIFKKEGAFEPVVFENTDDNLADATP